MYIDMFSFTWVKFILFHASFSPCFSFSVALLIMCSLHFYILFLIWKLKSIFFILLVIHFKYKIINLRNNVNVKNVIDNISNYGRWKCWIPLYLLFSNTPSSILQILSVVLCTEFSFFISIIFTFNNYF